jgi:hypothetical protein
MSARFRWHLRVRINGTAAGNLTGDIAWTPTDGELTVEAQLVAAG